MSLSALPDGLADVVSRYMTGTGDDFASPEAMAGRCEDHSRALAKALDGLVLDGEPVEAWTNQIWTEGVPAALECNELAGGHYVTTVRWQGRTWRVDLTAAQFPELGWTGPRAREI